MRRTREEWRALVAEFRDSGVRAAEFARRRGLALNTLQWWCWKLRGDVVKAGPVTLAKFVPLRPAASTVSGSQVLDARIGSVVLRFECGTDVDYVASLIGHAPRRHRRRPCCPGERVVPTALGTRGVTKIDRSCEA